MTTTKVLPAISASVKPPARPMPHEFWVHTDSGIVYKYHSASHTWVEGGGDGTTFPASPAVNDTHIYGDLLWIWNGTGWVKMNNQLLLTVESEPYQLSSGVIAEVVTMALPVGAWDVDLFVRFSGDAGTVATMLSAGVSDIQDNVPDLALDRYASWGADTVALMSIPWPTLHVGTARISVGSYSPIYGSIKANFSGGTLYANVLLKARKA